VRRKTPHFPSLPKPYVQEWVIQVGIDYLIWFDFMQTYIAQGWEKTACALNGRNIMTTDQFEANNKIPLGAMLQAYKGSAGYKHITAHTALLDGVRVWYAFLHEYDNLDNTAAKKTEIESELE
jgi:hypothetical protein